MIDALNMKGVTSLFKPGFTAFKVGNDVLLFPREPSLAIDLIKNEIAAGKIPYSQLQQSVRKILRAKYAVGLDHLKPVDRANLMRDLNRKAYVALKEKLFERAVTVLRNRGTILPIKTPSGAQIAYVPLGKASGATFYKALNPYAQVDEIRFLKNPGLALAKLGKYDLVIIGLH